MKYISVSDLHFRDDKPRCRVEKDWFGTQRRKLQWLIEQVNTHKCPLIIAGDLLDSGNVSSLLENMLIEEFNKAEYPIYSIAGNHDMLYHSIKHLKKGSYWVLVQAGAIQHLEEHTPLFDTTITPFQYGETMENGEGIAICHRLVTRGTPPPYLTTAISAEDLLDMYDYDIILSGDFHDAYYVEKDGKVLVNGGSILRQTADKKYTIPKIFLYDDGNITEIEVPVNIEDVQQEYLIEEKDRENRINVFVERVQVSHDLGLSFEDNIKASLKETPLEDSVTEIIYKALGGTLIG